MNRNLNLRDSEPQDGPGFEEAYRLVSGEVSQLREARRALDARLQKAEAARDLLRQLLIKNSTPLMDTEPFSAKATPGTRRFHKGSKTFEVVTRSLQILKDAGRPLDRAELLERLEASGYTVSSRNPARFIGRTLWESDRFIHIPKVGYWIANEEVPSN